MHVHPTPNVTATLERLEKKAEAEKPKFCKDCVFHSCLYERDEGKIRHSCKHPFCLDVVTGRPTNPYDNRKSDFLCGRAGRWFERRAVKIRTAAMTEVQDE